MTDTRTPVTHGELADSIEKAIGSALPTIYLSDDKLRMIVAALRAFSSETKPSEREERYRSALLNIASYTGRGPMTADWRDIVRSLGESAREALKEKSE